MGGGSVRTAPIRQQLIEQLMREIMHYDAEFRREESHHRISPKKWQNIRLSSDVTNPLSRSRN